MGFTTVIHGIQDSFNNTKCHAGTKDTNSIPESTKKNHMPHIPDPFKTKWKHNISPLFLKSIQIQLPVVPSLIPAPEGKQEDIDKQKQSIKYHMQQVKL